MTERPRGAWFPGEMAISIDSTARRSPGKLIENGVGQSRGGACPAQRGHSCRFRVIIELREAGHKISSIGKVEIMYPGSAMAGSGEPVSPA